MAKNVQEFSRRLDEINFIILIQTLFKKSANPMYVYDYIELICGICERPFLHIQHIINLVLAQERSILPKKEEVVYLYRMLGYSVRDICKETHISQRDYYNYTGYQPDTEQYFHTEPRFSEEEDATIRAILKFVYTIAPGKRGDL